MRRHRMKILLSLGVLLLGTAAWLLFATTSCSERDPATAPPAASHTMSSESSATSTPSRTPSPRSTRTGTGPPETRPPQVAEAEGWRLGVLRPSPGATIGRSLTVCYEVAGTSREPVLELDAALVPTGGGGPPERARSGIGVGRGSVILSFADAAEGSYELRLRLKVDGRWITGLAVTVPDVRLAHGPARGGCG